MPNPEDVKPEDNKPGDEPKGADTPAGEKDSGNSSQYSSVEDAIAEIERLKAINADVIAGRNEVKEKLRKIEEDKAKALEEQAKEQGKYKELYEAEVEKAKALQDKFRNTVADATLTSELSKAGAIAVETALPLINRTKLQFDDDGALKPESVVEAITEVKEKHKVLFGEKPQIPDAKRAGTGSASGGYLDELKQLQQNPRATQRDFQALKQKYNL